MNEIKKIDTLGKGRILVETLLSIYISIPRVEIPLLLSTSTNKQKHQQLIELNNNNNKKEQYKFQ